MRDDKHTSMRVGRLASGTALGRLPSRDEERAIQSVCAPRVAAGLDAAQRAQRRQADYAPDGFTACDECFGAPNQYLIDVGETCPTCLGAGVVEDRDQFLIDGFDPHREFGTAGKFRRHF